MYASVIVAISNKNVDRLFTYKIPEHLEDKIQPGSRVFVSFGPRMIQGFVVEVKNDTDLDPSKIKPIQKVMDVYPVLTKELIHLSKKLADYYVERHIKVIEAILPAALKMKSRSVLKLSDDASTIARETFKKFDDEKIDVKLLDMNDLKQLMPFINSKEIIEEKEFSQHTKKKTRRGIESCYLDIKPSSRAVKQIELLELVEDRGPLTYEQIEEEGYSIGVINALVDNGFCKKIDILVERDPYEGRVFYQDKKKILTHEQQHAFDTIKKSIDDDTHETFLLHGITGSGKTEVYLQVIEEVLNRGENAIMMVPEIALTPQMVQRFKSRFGDDVAVIHSMLSHGERYDEWRKIREGRARISIGARSNVFAAFQNVGCIIIDEEHESTYKQNERPYYHARLVAKWRAEYYNCPLILGSATPSIESYARSEVGVYQRLELTERPTEQTVPIPEIVNMVKEREDGNTSIISRKLDMKIRDRISKDEQMILLLNRRGYANFLVCQNCGHVPMCPNCDISLTYHKSNNSLMCHYCAYEEPMPTKCGACGEHDLSLRGTGTQKIEEILRDTYQVDVVRMDIDTTRNKGAHETLLNKFEKDNIPILLGTQMIAKGLDFKNVTLVGVLNADTILNLPDFRANERTFQLLTQVSGRAGRGDVEGEVIFQTYNEDHYAIQFAKENDYRSFYLREMEYRKLARYSPYYFHVLFTISSEYQDRVIKAASDIHTVIQKDVSNRSILIGPSPSPIERIQNKYRFQIILKYKSEPELFKVLHELDNKYSKEYQKTQTSLRIDVDPEYIM